MTLLVAVGIVDPQWFGMLLFTVASAAVMAAAVGGGAGAGAGGGAAGITAQTYVEMLLEEAVRFLSVRPPFDRVIKAFGANRPAKVLATLILPGAVAKLAAMAITPRIFGNTAEVLRDLVAELGKQVAMAISRGPGGGMVNPPAPGEVTQTVTSVWQTVSARPVVVSQGHYHFLNCLFVPQRNQWNRQGVREMSLLDAVDSGAASCFHCHGRLEKLLAMPDKPKPDTATGGMSVSQLVMTLDDPADRKFLRDAIRGLTTEEKHRLARVFDGQGEAMYLVEEVREGHSVLDVLAFLETQSPRTQMKEDAEWVFGQLADGGNAVGGAIKTAATFTRDQALDGWNNAGQAARDWDASLASTVTSWESWADRMCGQQPQGGQAPPQQQPVLGPPPLGGAPQQPQQMIVAPRVGFWRQLIRDLFSW
ncbi:MAG: hypothetical protein ABIJ57_03520 [Pseudomonadota bacterium]